MRLNVLMARDGRFRVCAHVGPDPGIGVAFDGRMQTEWDATSKSWTRYDTEQPADGTGLRLVRGGSIVTARVQKAIQDHAQSWLKLPTPFAKRFESLHAAGRPTAISELRDGRRCDGLELRTGVPNAELLLEQVARMYFDAQSALPLRMEYLVQAKAPFVSVTSESTFIIDYDQVIRNPPLEESSFTFTAPADFTYVEPRPAAAGGEELVGRPFPNREMTTITGEVLQTRREKRTQPTIIVVWATYCSACKVELRELPQLLEREKLGDVRVIALSVDSSASRLRRGLARTSLGFHVVHDPGFLERLGLDESLPQTLVLDGEGVIRAVIVAWGDDAKHRALVEAVQAVGGE